MRVGSVFTGDDKCEFIVWAPTRESVSLKVVAPEKQLLPMTKNADGYWRITVENAAPDTSYFYRLDDEIDRADPASNFQPVGVHAASRVVNHVAFKWRDDIWNGRPLEDMIIYELHVGTFSPEGTFEGVISRLDDLQKLGINTIELMPVAQFPGERNWGYDGVYPYAAQNSYGGPEGLKRLVNACHQRGMSVVLDVVYNHLGPEGNYLRDFGPYFTQKYQTPWGEAVNFDDAYSDGVRNYFIENALYWFQEFHIDALRLDAVHAIFDFSAKHFLKELAEKTQMLSNQLGRQFRLIAESDLNDMRIIRPMGEGGYGLHAQWCDDFHHSLRTALTNERGGYYMDFDNFNYLEKSYKQGLVYDGIYSKHRKRRHGDICDRPANQFVVYSQNHDQVGNRMLGERLTSLVSYEALKLTAGAVLLSPYIPMLFMGEEYGEEAPFLYFIDHSDSDLVEAVRKGRKAEFRSFEWRGEPPDPKSEETFQRSKLRWNWEKDGNQKNLRELYRELIQYRKQLTALAHLDNQKLETVCLDKEKLLLLRRWDDKSQVFAALNFNENDVTFKLPFKNKWTKVLDSSDERWLGPGTVLPTKTKEDARLTISPLSFVLYEFDD